jgi:flagellar hook protein FlgE
MIRALYSGISGMRAFQTKLDVISNNVANVNTTGYKMARTTFRDILSQTISSGTIPNDQNGGINARQIGLGVGVASIDTIFNQGSAQSTGVKTDLMIEGDGFFVVSETSSGSALGPNNYVNVVLQDIQYDIPDENNPNQGTATIQLNFNPIKSAGVNPEDIVEYKLFQDGQEIGTIQPSELPTEVTALQIGTKYEFTVRAIVNDPENPGETKELEEGSPLVIQPDPNATLIGKASVDSIGLLFTRAGNFYFDKNRNLVTADGLFVMDTTGNKIQIDPLAVAYNIDERGYIVQVNNKGEQIASVQRIGIAKFQNPQGLEKVGSTRFRYTRVADQSDQPRNYIFESDNFEKGTGKIRSGFLEMSNVDLGVEFSEMIMAQRGFQANTRIITTSDEVLQEVVNLKR